MVLIKVMSYVCTGLLVCFISCPVLTLIALAQGPIIFIGMGLVGYTHSIRAKRKSEAYSAADGIAEETLSEVKTVAACCAQPAMIDKYTEKLAQSRKTMVTLGLVHGLGWSFVSIARCVSAALVFWYGAKLMKDKTANWIWGDTIDPSDVVVVFFVVGAVFQFLGNIVPSVHAIVEGRQAGYRAFDVMYHPQRTMNGFMKPNIGGAIEFRDVTFSYPACPDVTVLDELSFTIPKGQTVGIVGESGAGKSTIIHLIERFYDPTTGSIFLDGIDLRKFDLRHVRAAIGLVSQEPVLFNTTVKANLLLGCPSASDTDVNWALEQAAAKGFICDFPDGLETRVGSKGSKLSGGQKQRIAIARALLKRPKIVLFDEATSSLDARNEAEIQATMDELISGLRVTCVVIAQKLSTVRHCDKIVVLSKGTKVEEGSHDFLMGQAGKYHELVSLQACDSAAVSTSADSSESRGSTSSSTKDEESVQDSDREEDIPTTNAVSKVMAISGQYCHYILIAVATAVVAGATFPIFGYLIAEEMHYITSERGKDMVADSRHIAYWLFGLAGVSFVAYFLMSYSTTIATAEMTSDLRRRGFGSLLHHDAAFFDKKENASASLTQNLSGDCEKVNNAGGPLLAMAVMMTASLLIGCGLGLCYAWKLGVVITLCTPLLVIGMMRGYLVKVESSELKEYDTANTICSDAVMNIRTVYSLNAQSILTEKYLVEHAKVSNAQLKGSHMLGVFFGFGLMAMFYVYALAFWYGAYQVKEDDLKVKDMNIALYACLMGSIGMMVASIFAPDLAAGRKAAVRLFRIIDYTSDASSSHETGLKGVIQGKVEFRNVEFVYPSRNTPVLKDLSFVIPAGTALGLTGYSGAGKSTVVQLLVRFYDCSKGRILIDGCDIRDFNLQALRSQMAVVFQEPVLFSGSISDNISFGFSPCKEADIVQAAEQAQALKFIQKHTDSFSRNVGVKGSNLSGGQKQRIAIARAILRNPKILIFDEATSALDSKTERKLQAALSAAQHNRTCLVIAHRASTLHQMPRIALIDDGHIRAIGGREVLTPKCV